MYYTKFVSNEITKRLTKYISNLTYVQENIT